MMPAPRNDRAGRTVRSPVRQVAASIALGAALLAAVPAAVSAECTGPTCADSSVAVEGLSLSVLIVILLVFGTVLAVAEARRR